uniref:Uncharacterized protein n=1 Tax=Romanomermis culicivorax TaxID=13658 RepID=A0A915JTT9_ROMCU
MDNNLKVVHLPEHDQEFSISSKNASLIDQNLTTANPSTASSQFFDFETTNDHSPLSAEQQMEISVAGNESAIAASRHSPVSIGAESSASVNFQYTPTLTHQKRVLFAVRDWSPSLQSSPPCDDSPTTAGSTAADSRSLGELRRLVTVKHQASPQQQANGCPCRARQTRNGGGDVRTSDDTAAAAASTMHRWRSIKRVCSRCSSKLGQESPVVGAGGTTGQMTNKNLENASAKLNTTISMESSFDDSRHLDGNTADYTDADSVILFGDDLFKVIDCRSNTFSHFPSIEYTSIKL